MPELKKLKASFILILLAVSLMIFPKTILPQTKSNLEMFYSLADSSVNMFIRSDNPNGKIYTEVITNGTYSIFNSHILGYLQSKELKIISEKGTVSPQFLYSIEKISTAYGDIFRDGFLGTYLVERKLTYKGNYLYTGKELRDFNLVYSDTVNVDDIKNLENSAFNFTVGIVPPEPFFSGLFEPVAALGTAAAAVILFFTVRSK